MGVGAAAPRGAGMVDTAPIRLAAARILYVLVVFGHIRGAVGDRLAFPSIEQGQEEGAVALIWSRGHFYAEVELHADGTHEWFFRDRTHDTHDGSDGPARGLIAPRFCELLKEAVARPEALSED